MRIFMTDIETLGLDDDTIIIQVGFICYDTVKQIELARLSVNIDTMFQIINGRTITPSTVEFWNKQKSDVLKNIESSSISPYEAADYIIRFIEHLKEDDSQLWANGLLFDINKLDSFCSMFGGGKKITSLFKYSNIRDYRTLRNHFKETQSERYKQIVDRMPEMTAHNAIDDCLYQLIMLMEILRG